MFPVSNNILNVLLVEDDNLECKKFEKCIKKRNDVQLLAYTGSDVEALELIKQLSPDAIILDIELHNGTGNSNSFNLIETLQKMKFAKRPKIVVNTVVSSNTIYDYLHDKGVDLIFYKKQQNYSIDNILDTLVLLSGYSSASASNDIAEIEDTKENEEKISAMIDSELNLIGIGIHLEGRKYLHDAIYYLITNAEASERISAVQFLVNKYKRSSSTISRDMQNAILRTWRLSSLDDLETYYTARINYETGVPTPTEFIYYYADKIRKSL